MHWYGGFFFFLFNFFLCGWKSRTRQFASCAGVIHGVSMGHDCTFAHMSQLFLFYFKYRDIAESQGIPKKERIKKKVC